MKNILLFKHTKLLFLLSLLFFSNWGWGQIVAFEFAGRNGFYIGCHQYLTEKDLECIIDSFRKILR